MFLPRDLIAHLYNHLTRSHHAQSPPVLLLVALEPDALCACQILTALLKRDYIPHTIIPVSGYGDLSRAGETQVQSMRLQNGGSGGTVICLGVGGLVDLAAVLGLEATEGEEDGTGGVEIWVIDARRPWNLGNVFGGKPPDLPLRESNVNGRVRLPDVDMGQIQQSYRPGRGGIIVYDDGDVREELGAEREAYFKLDEMPAIDDDGQESDGSDTESEQGDFVADPQPAKKRKSWSDADEDEDSDEENQRPRQRQRSNSVALEFVQSTQIQQANHSHRMSQSPLLPVVPPEEASYSPRTIYRTTDHPATPNSNHPLPRPYRLPPDISTQLARIDGVSFV